MPKLERITEIDACTWECEGTDDAVNDYLATKDPAYLRRSTVEISRNHVKGTVIARVTSEPAPAATGLLSWQRVDGRLQIRRGH